MLKISTCIRHHSLAMRIASPPRCVSSSPRLQRTRSIQPNKKYTRLPGHHLASFEYARQPGISIAEPGYRVQIAASIAQSWLKASPEVSSIRLLHYPKNVSSRGQSCITMSYQPVFVFSHSGHVGVIVSSQSHHIGWSAYFPIRPSFKFVSCPLCISLSSASVCLCILSYGPVD